MPAPRDETPRPLKLADLSHEIELHRRALADFVATAEEIDPGEWDLPAQEEKWSPAQVTEHLRLSYAIVCSELAGRGGPRIRTRRWQRLLFRLLYLPRILKRGRFPQGVPAIREIRPAPGPFARQELLAAFGDEGERFLAAAGSAAADGGATISHPFLGPLTLVEGVRFMTRHVRHHQAQIAGGAPAPRRGQSADSS